MKGNCRYVKTSMPERGSQDHGNSKLYLEIYSQPGCPHHRFDDIALYHKDLNCKKHTINKIPVLQFCDFSLKKQSIHMYNLHRMAM